MLHKALWISTPNHLHNGKSYGYVQISCSGQINDDVQQETFPNRQTITNQISQVIVKYECGIGHVLVCSQKNTVLLTLSQTVNRNDGFEIGIHRRTHHSNESLTD